MTKKKETKKKKKLSYKYFVLLKDPYRNEDRPDSPYGWEFQEAFTTEAAALKAIEKYAMDDGHLGNFIIAERSSNVKVSLKIEAINKKETKAKK